VVADEPHLVNTLGVVALGVTTDMTAEVEAATGCSLKEVAALTTLANWADGRSIEVLRTVLEMSQPGCARLVDRLVEGGLATRARDPRDRRVVTVRITARGRRVVTAAQTARAAAVQRWLTGLPAGEAATLTLLLDRLSSARVRDSADVEQTMNTQCRLCDPAACGFPDRCATSQAPSARH
jgi:MarR family transcriptional regulator, negative regulator of the multidrug operon emrRAB